MNFLKGIRLLRNVKALHKVRWVLCANANTKGRLPQWLLWGLKEHLIHGIAETLGSEHR